MSPLDRPVPPAGEELHVPGGSLQPVGLAAFITIGLVGVTIWWPLCVVGGLGALIVIVRWIREARAEMAELPVHHPGS